MIIASQDTGVLEEAVLAFEGSIDGPTFLGYVENCLVPALARDRIVVIDELSAHKVQGVCQAIEGAGCDVWYLPAHSPDLPSH